MKVSTPRILFLGGSRYSFPLGHSQERKFAALSRMMRMDVIAFSRGWIPCSFAYHARFMLLPLLPGTALRFLTMSLLAPPLIIFRSLRHPYDVLCCQSAFEGVIGVCVVSLLRIVGRRPALVVEFHSDVLHTFFQERKRPLARTLHFLLRILVRFAIRHADVVRTVSQDLAASVRMIRPTVPIVTFPAWVPLSTFLPLAAGRKKPSQPVILFAGVLIPRKGVLELIDAFGRIRSAHSTARLLLVGRRENKDYARLLDEKIVALGLQECVEMAGEVSSEDLGLRMAKSTVLVLPSYAEGQPRILLEAMAAGLPVIATAVNGVPEIVQDGQQGFLVRPGELEELVVAMDHVLRMDTWEQMSRNAHAWMKERYSEEQFAENMYRLFLKANPSQLR